MALSSAVITNIPKMWGSALKCDESYMFWKKWCRVRAGMSLFIFGMQNLVTVNINEVLCEVWIPGCGKICVTDWMNEWIFVSEMRINAVRIKSINGYWISIMQLTATVCPLNLHGCIISYEFIISKKNIFRDLQRWTNVSLCGSRRLHNRALNNRSSIYRPNYPCHVYIWLRLKCISI